jgi:hypothetical protein
MAWPPRDIAFTLKLAELLQKRSGSRVMISAAQWSFSVLVCMLYSI